MDAHDYQSLLDEREILFRRFKRTKPNQVDERIRLADRLKEIAAELEPYAAEFERPNRVTVTFRGNPAADCYGIRADFCGAALTGFAAALAAVSSSHGGKPAAGDQFLFHAPTTGDIGFVIVDADPESNTIAAARSVIAAAAGKDDRKLSQAIANCDRPARHALRDFLHIVADASAACSITTGNRTTGFKTPQAVRAAANQLDDDHIKEVSLTLRGQFIGYLPANGAAEFRVTESPDQTEGPAPGTVIEARVDASAANADQINRILRQEVEITATAQRVGQAPANYTITGYTPTAE